MKNFEMAGFSALSNDDLQTLDGGGILSDLVNQVEGIVNPLVATLDGLLSSLPLPSLPGLGGLGGLPILGGLGL